jgi:NADH-quinone oxidoreductase subunit E
MKNKILIVDDDADFREATKLILLSNDYDVITASNGQEGYQKIREESPDLVLLDMRMTYKTEGADVAKAVSQDAAFTEIPVILITGAKKEADSCCELEPNGEHLPVKTVLEKPVQPDDLLKVVDKYIKKTGLHHREIVGEIDKLVTKWKDKKGNLIMILHEIQNHYGYIPRGVSFELSRLLNVPLARIYEVITFYNYFKLEPPGKHLISVCMGTACYLKGGNQILEELKKILNVEEGQTSEDGLFHLQVVRCLGCCGLAPVVMIDEDVHGNVRPEKVMEILSKYTKKEITSIKEGLK